MKPSDVALGDGLAAAFRSLRVFMRRVRRALRRASIGGSQVIASQVAQNATKVAAATMITKLFSVLARSTAVYTLMVAILFITKMPTPMLQAAAAAII